MESAGAVAPVVASAVPNRVKKRLLLFGQQPSLYIESGKCLGQELLHLHVIHREEPHQNGTCGRRHAGED